MRRLNFRLLCAAMVCFLGGSAQYLGVTKAAAPPSAMPALDAVHTPASTRFWIKLSPTSAVRMNKPGKRPGAAGGEDPQQLPLSRELRAQCEKWGVNSIRPAYPFAFQNPVLASQLGLDRVYILEVPQGTNTPEVVESLRQQGGEVERAGTDIIGDLAEFVPNDPEFTMQYGLNNSGQPICNPACVPGTPDADIDAPEAWMLHDGAAGGVTIAFLDSGIFPHEEFAGRILPGVNVNEPENPVGTLDTIGHGTHVAGIATAQGNNGVGIAGLNWGANILPVRVTNAGGATSGLHVGNGLIWATDQGADVINMSVQFYTFTDSADNLAYLEDAATYAHAQGAVLVAASGNGPRSACTITGNLCVTNAQCAVGEQCVNIVAFPAKYDTVIAVGGTNSRDEHHISSNSGPELEISAPSDSVWSLGIFGGNLYQSGTSMSTAFVSGAAALLKSYVPALTNDEIRSILAATADDLGPPGRDPQFGFGRLNLYAALLSVTDSDGDGVSDMDDNCLSVPNADQVDTDGDGAGDVCDDCPVDPFKTDPGICGCGQADTDSDGDAVANCVDGCPTDHAKTMPEQCGCHAPETDSDGDGVADCVDGCPNDPQTVSPGVCGCGQSEVGDSDGDGILDCVDICPGVDDAVFGPACDGAIPTVSQWGLISLALLLLTAAKLRFGRLGESPAP